MKGQRLPETMRVWNTRGTPEVAVVDKGGQVRFRRFGSFDPAPVRELLDELLAEGLAEAGKYR